MDAVFADTARIYTTGALASIRCNREQLLATLRAAADCATSHGHSVLASFVQPLGKWNSLDIFMAATHAELGDCFFWERPSDQTAFVGIGTATTLTTSGSTHITAATSAWRTLLQHAVIRLAQEDILSPVVPKQAVYSRGRAYPHPGPLFFGGFCFDPLSPRTNLWQAFPDGLLILPRLLLSSNASGATLTLNTLIQANEDSEQCAEELLASIMRLQAALEKP